ncbi:MAG TPA: four helix bundle protein [bacterium]|nr:four helix bundle protein [bacterium]
MVKDYDVKKFARDLECRTKMFAIQIIRLSQNIPNTSEGRVIKNQVTKSGTSIGANYREANRARSKADFRNKIRICESEASETQYWLEIIRECRFAEEEDIQAVLKECSELLALFTAIRTRNQF